MYGSTLIGKTTKTTGFLSVVCYFQFLRLFFSLDKSMLRHFYRIHCPNKLRKGGICGLKPWRFCFFSDLEPYVFQPMRKTRFLLPKIQKALQDYRILIGLLFFQFPISSAHSKLNLAN